MKKSIFTKALLFTAAAAFLVGCKGEKKAEGTEETTGGEFPRSETLYMGGWDWAAPSTFNPLASDPNFPIDANIKLMYESLLAYDQNTGKLEPMLATSYEVKDEGITVTLDNRALWSNGEKVTAEDVLYTFQLHKDFNTPRHSDWNFLEKVEAVGDSQVVFVFKKSNKNPLVVLDMISESSILPKSVFSKLRADSKDQLTEMLKFKNDSDPVVSGPYNLEMYSNQKIALKRRDDYWGKVLYEGKLPGPKYIVHSLYNGNNHFNSAMVKGHLDISSIFMPRIWDKTKDKIRAWSLKEPYHQPGSIPTLFMGLTKEPFINVKFRRALAHLVNFGKIKTLAVSNYTPDVKPGFILPVGTEAQYFSEEDAAKYGYTYDIEKAKSLLKEAGYSWNAEGKLLDKSGVVMRSIDLECPQGWTDWENTIKIVIEGLKAVGIDAREKFVDYGVWDTDVKQGTFDLVMKTQTADLFPSTPWKRFDQVMSSNDLRPVGETMYQNFGRYKNPEVDALLKKLPTLTNQEEIVAAYRELNIKFMQEVPVLTLMYRPTSFYQFSTRHWTNYPTEENPYASPQGLMVGAGVKGLWGIKPVQ